MKSTHPAMSPLPSVDTVIGTMQGKRAVAQFGHQATVGVVREVLSKYRSLFLKGLVTSYSAESLARESSAALEEKALPRLRRVFNLTGTVLHTNLGRALLAHEAIESVALAMAHPVALEFDLATGQRGERDDIVRGLICQLTGAEDCCVVNNNAAALMLVLNTLANGSESIVSRGELIEIGGSFRLPEIMAQAGTRLIEVGTTNRTHLRDYVGAVTDATKVILKVHTSNYLVKGFTKEATAGELSKTFSEMKIPVVDDLGSGTLVRLEEYGLAHERTAQEALDDGADLVMFSGDKILGGPQCGFVIGRHDLVRRCAKNPMKRAMRLDKLRLAALETTLRLYLNPEKLAERLPTLRFLTRSQTEIEALAERLRPKLAVSFKPAYDVAIRSCASQIGSGALPLEKLPSAGLAIVPSSKKHVGRKLERLSEALRDLPIPVIGRLDKGALVLDVRCLDDERGFVRNFQELALPPAAGEDI